MLIVGVYVTVCNFLHYFGEQMIQSISMDLMLNVLGICLYFFGNFREGLSAKRGEHCMMMKYSS